MYNVAETFAAEASQGGLSLRQHVASDWTWCHHLWHVGNEIGGPHFTLTIEIKSQISISKVMLIAFCDIEWPLHLDFRSCNIAVTKDCSLQILQKLCMKIKNECQHKVTDGIILLHSNVCTHVADRMWD